MTTRDAPTEILCPKTDPVLERAAAVGIDIGGANLKAAHTERIVVTRPFALWREPDLLPVRLRELLGDFPHHDLLAVTMTGELCDCFASKAEGVNVILDAVAKVARCPKILVWQNSGQFVGPDEARRNPLLTAASNWLALGTFAGRFTYRGSAMIVDMGSTTTDFIPMRGNLPTPLGRTDLDRLLAGELVYSGVERTPLCAVAPTCYFRGQPVRLAAEWFATTKDIYLLLGQLPEDPADLATADGRPFTKEFSAARLARMLCADLDQVTRVELQTLAQDLRASQVGTIKEAYQRLVKKLPEPPRTLILAGAGEFLLRQLAVNNERVVLVSQQLGPEISRAACAHAVAVLARERHG